MTEKRKGRPWKPGQSGNPAGRPRGVPDRRAAWRAELGEALPLILRRLIADALNGDTAAAALLLARVAPPLRPSREPVEVEGAADAQTPHEIAQAVLSAAVRGTIPTDHAAELGHLLAAAAKLREVDDFAERLRALEAANATR